MQHFRLDALQEKAGRLYLHDKPFTGIAYEVQGDRVVANYQVTDGVRGGPAVDWDPARIRALDDAITVVDYNDTNEQFPKEGTYFDGAIFEGIMYQFDDSTGILLKEQDLRPTYPAPGREWYRSGALAADYDRPRPDGTWESETYYEDGRTSTVHTDKVRWGITPEGHLRTLNLSRGYPKNELKRVPFRVDSRLYLVSRGVTDEIVERLEDLPRLEYLRLDDTKISAKGLKRFRICTNLKEFITENNTGFGDADVRKLVNHLPGCKWDRR